METKLKIWRKTWGRQSCEGGLPEHAPHVSGTDAWHSASGLRCNAGWRLGPARYMVRGGWGNRQGTATRGHAHTGTGTPYTGSAKTRGHTYDNEKRDDREDWEEEEPEKVV